ncbi:unnamed protein product [Peniophora sp. CBMAI 1063]|nr:unnamed protein product [Peniophora sp. CBMAI 1063]
MATARLPIAQTLPEDILCELFTVCAILDPPTRRDIDGLRRSTRLLAGLRPDAPMGTLAPAWSTLPVERLERDDDDVPALVSTGGLAADTTTLGWIRLTHTCARWRAVGIRLPRLWADIFPVLPHAADVILARSRDAPLSLDMDLTGRLFGRKSNLLPPFLHLAQQHIARARILTFPRYLGTQWNPNLLRDIQLPFLQTLRISISYLEAAHPDFALHAPALTHLMLDGAFVPSFVGTSLKYLQITQRARGFDAVSLLDLLFCVPVLEELVLELYYVQEAEARASASSTPLIVSLAKLSYAQITGTPDTLTFLNCLRVPQTASLSFFVQRRPHRHGSILPLLQVLTPRLQDFSINCMSFNPGSYVDVCLASSRAGGSEPAPRTFLRTDFNGVTRELGSLSAYLAQFFTRMEPSNITSFHAGSYTLRDITQESDDPFQYANLLDQLSGLTTLSLSWLPARYQPFLVALGLSPGPDTLDTVTVFSEDSLAAYDNHFYEPRIVLSAAESVSQRWQDILSMLRYRADNDRRLKRLVLKGLHVTNTGTGWTEAWTMRRVADLVDHVVDDRTEI